MVNPFVVSDKNSRSSKIKNAVLKRIKTYSLSRSNLIIVIGGDGFMLETLKKYNKYKKPFYGINAGSYGFLMNKFSSKKNSFFYYHEEKKYSVFYKNSQRSKMFNLFQGNTENKLKALKIAEDLADKSTLPILRKGLRDVSPEVVEISALLIRKFK